jgi:hypothetical protein
MHGLFVYVTIAYPKLPVSAFGQPFRSANDRVWLRIQPICAGSAS